MESFRQLAQRLISAKPAELPALVVSGATFFMILCAYYVIRPIRDEMVIANGVANLHWLFLATVVTLILLTPVFGWITTRYRTSQFLTTCTLFFASHLVVFYFLFAVEQRAALVTQAFYVWVGVFNMFIVSLFWSLMNDVFSREQAKRLFASIAVGGTLGAITGPSITKTLVQNMGFAPLLLISASLLAASVGLMLWLVKWKNTEYNDELGQTHQVKNQALKGSIIGGFTLVLKSPYLLGICGFILLYAMSITLVQIRQAELIATAYQVPEQRAELFATIDLTVNVLVLIFQLFLTNRLIQFAGFRAALLIIPLGITIGFGLMAAAPLLAVMITLEIFRRAGDYAIMKPMRDMLFSVVSREEKYKAKNVIDTTVVRMGGMSSTWLAAGLRSLAGSAALMTGISLLLGIAWCAMAFWLGNQFQSRQKGEQATKKTH